MRHPWLTLPLLALPLLTTACGDKDEPAEDTGTDEPVDADGDGFDVEEDCDDTDDTVFPGADERCNGVDDDCDGDTDEEAVDAGTWYADTDGDGFGDEDAAVAACEVPEEHVAEAGDCDDTDGEVNPDAEEVCDGVDNDCVDGVDEGASDAGTWYADADGDGYGDADSPVTTCDVPSGYTSDDTDCDDTRADVNPGATEVCDDADNDCDGLEGGGLMVPGTYSTVAEAIAAATDGDEICIAAGTYNEKLDLDGTSLSLTGAHGADQVILNGQGAGSGPVLMAIRGETLGVRGLTITGGSGSEVGGVWLMDATASFEDVRLTGNEGLFQGAGLSASDSVISFLSSEISDNSLSGEGYLEGAGIYVYGGNLELVDSVVSGNSLGFTGDDNSFVYGAGICAWQAEVSLTDTVLEDNRIEVDATGYTYAGGAGLYTDGGSLILDGVELSGNVVEATSESFVYVEGGALYVLDWTGDAAPSLTDVALLDNDATATSTDSFAYVYGGPAAFYGAIELELQGLTARGNTGTAWGYDNGYAYGGGFYAFEPTIAATRLDIRDNLLVSNDAAFGAAIALDWASVDLDNGILAGNAAEADATVYGGVLYQNWDDLGWYVRDPDGDVQLSQVDIAHNSATADTILGAVLHQSWDGTLSLHNTNVVGNTATAGTALSGAVGWVDAGSDALTVSYVNSHDNPTGADAFEDGDGALSVGTLLDLDPSYTDVSATDPADWDLSLASGSAAVDAGDPAVQDADGSTSDLGAYGGPGGADW